MQIYFGRGAMYAELDEHDELLKVPVELGDRLLYPGDYVCKLGHKKRASFEMKPGFYLKYIGMVKKTLLFGTNAGDTENMFYAFFYINKNKLLVQGTKNGFWDIDVEKLEVYKDVPQKELLKQLSLF
ncbi:hypothetical protein CTH_2282 [Carboxydocella thermautotrophica]|nr:hypothetical protein CTH_2282 [Carboxydocella thermautotrophica]